MKSLRTTFLFIATLIVAASPGSPALGQVAKTGVAKPSIVVAVLSGGTYIEPITIIDKGKILVAADNEEEFPKIDTYFSPKRKFDLIFGGKRAGSVEVIKRQEGECAGTSAEVSVKATGAKLSGFVMALATDLPTIAPGAGSRRRPTAVERAEIEKLVRSAFSKAGAPKTALQKLRYQNLTAMDLDADGKPEFVGSYWIAPKAKERRLLFFIAESRDGTIRFAHSDLNTVTPEEMMAGAEMSHIDEGAGHELLLDALDYDADGVAEIFTTLQAFEGRNFHVYGRRSGKWERVHQSYNYRCAF